MPNDQNSQGRRPHYHRGRRGGDRRGLDRRSQHAPEQGGRDQVNVEQIMRDIRARIARRHGIDLSPQQIQELAARRLEAILEPKHVKPALLEQMRRAAGEPIAVPPPPADAPGTALDESALYESHRGFLNTLRRWLNPILKLFINPAPLVQAVNAQGSRAAAAAARESELYSQQAEWNALHYEILQRLVAELARATIETQNLSLKVEALSAKVDFNERRVRSLENTGQQSRPQLRAGETAGADTPREPAAAAADVTRAAPSPEGNTEGTRRRRRRRRGRRSGGPMGADAAATVAAPGAADSGEDADVDELDSDAETDASLIEPQDHRSDLPHASADTALEPAHAFSLLQPVERHPFPDVPSDTAPAPSGPAHEAQPPQTAFTAPAVHQSDDAPAAPTAPISGTEPEPDDRS